MFGSYLAKDAFAGALEKKVEKNYRSLYPDEDVITTYDKESKESPEKFQNQFFSLLKALKQCGKNLGCLDYGLLAEVDRRAITLFNPEYSGNQAAEYFAIIKQNLEKIWFVLVSDKSVPDSKKLEIFKYLCDSMPSCAPGLYTHIEDALSALTTDVSLELWLAKMRTSIIQCYAELHISEYGISRGYSIHVFNAFLKFAADANWNPLSDVDKMQDPFIEVYTHVDEQALLGFSQFFAKGYTPEKILDCVTTNFVYELNQIKKGLSLKEDKAGWVTATPDFLKKVLELAKAINLSDGNFDFFELSDDSQAMRFNPIAFRACFLRACKTQKKLFNDIMWQEHKFSNDYKFFCLGDFNLGWFESPDDELINWQKLAGDVPALLSSILVEHTVDDWSRVVALSVGDLTRVLTNVVEFGKFLAPFKSCEKLYYLSEVLGFKYGKPMVQAAQDICKLLDVLPKDDDWRAAFVLHFYGVHKNYLFDAAEQGQAAVLKRLLVEVEHLSSIKRGNRFYKYIKECLVVDEENSDGWTLAHVAARHGHASVIQLLHECKANLNALNSAGDTPAFVAVNEGHVPVLQMLAECKADLNAVNIKGEKLLDLARVKKNLEVIKILSPFGMNAGKEHLELPRDVVVLKEEVKHPVVELMRWHFFAGSDRGGMKEKIQRIAKEFKN